MDIINLKGNFLSRNKDKILLSLIFLIVGLLFDDGYKITTCLLFPEKPKISYKVFIPDVVTNHTYLYVGIFNTGNKEARNVAAYVDFTHPIYKSRVPPFSPKIQVFDGKGGSVYESENVFSGKKHIGFVIPTLRSEKQVVINFEFNIRNTGKYSEKDFIRKMVIVTE